MDCHHSRLYRQCATGTRSTDDHEGQARLEEEVPAGRRQRARVHGPSLSCWLSQRPRRCRALHPRSPQRLPERFLPLGGGALHDLERESRAKVPPLSSTPGTNAYPASNFDPLRRVASTSSPSTSASPLVYCMRNNFKLVQESKSGAALATARAQLDYKAGGSEVCHTAQ